MAAASVGNQGRRTKLNPTARYMLPGGREHPCIVLDGSATHIALAGPERSEPGTPVVIYVDPVGWLVGEISRHLAGGFAVRLTGSRAVQAAFAQHLRRLGAPA
jgi:hypothetical protein